MASRTTPTGFSSAGEDVHRSGQDRAEAVNVSIVYDGLCPVCRHVARASRLRERTALLELVDARTQPVVNVQGRDLGGLDFNQGFAVVVDGTVHFGADAAQVLAALTERGGSGYRVFRYLVRTEARSRFFDPVFKAARRVLLFMLRVPGF